MRYPQTLSTMTKLAPEDLNSAHRDRAARTIQRHLRPSTIFNMELPSLGQPLEFHEKLVRAIAGKLGIPPGSVQVTISQSACDAKAAKTIQRAWRTSGARVLSPCTLHTCGCAAELLQHAWRGYSQRRRTAAALEIQYFWRVHCYTPDQWREWWAAEVLQNAWRHYSWRLWAARAIQNAWRLRLYGGCSCGRAAMGGSWPFGWEYLGSLCPDCVPENRAADNHVYTESELANLWGECRTR